MNFDNLEVKHKAFGAGVIVSKQGKYITVRFADVEKIFVYPDIFEKFLTLADGSISEDIANDISEAKAQKQTILNKKNEENMRAMTHGIVIPGKEVGVAESDEEESRFKQSEPEEI
jgi:hypothetical protein